MAPGSDDDVFVTVHLVVHGRHVGTEPRSEFPRRLADLGVNRKEIAVRVAAKRNPPAVNIRVAAYAASGEPITAA